MCVDAVGCYLLLLYFVRWMCVCRSEWNCSWQPPQYLWWEWVRGVCECFHLKNQHSTRSLASIYFKSENSFHVVAKSTVL